MLTTAEAKKSLQGYVCAIQRARSSLREGCSSSGPSSLDDVDREAAEIDPVLFSERGELLLQKLTEASEGRPDAFVVLNFSWMMRRLAGLDTDDPWMAPNVSHVLRITLASMDRRYDFTESPLSALTRPTSERESEVPV